MLQVDDELELKLEEDNLIAMKLIHYFVTKRGYNTIFINGLEDEMWLENMHGPYKIVRIVTRKMVNSEQVKQDVLRMKQVKRAIKKHTLTFHLNVLSIYLNTEKDLIKDVDDSVSAEELYTSKTILKAFPDVLKETDFVEEGLGLFIKITSEINEKNQKEALEMNKIFKRKIPIITYLLIFFNVFIFLLLQFEGRLRLNILGLGVLQHGLVYREKEYYRLFSATFLHKDFFHLAFNMGAIYILGSQVESYYGKVKYLIIYFFAALMGSVLSIALNGIEIWSIGASGAIFGIMGSLLYFGLYYRNFLGNVLINQILPIIVINLIFGFTSAGVDNFAHIGGLIGGYLTAMALGIDKKAGKDKRTMGFLMYLGFLVLFIYFGLSRL